jgi:hypothetical protein
MVLMVQEKIKLCVEEIPAEDKRGWELAAYWPDNRGSLVSVDVQYRENQGYTIVVIDKNCRVSVPKNYLHGRQEKALRASRRLFSRKVRELVAEMDNPPKIVRIGDRIETE